MIIKKLENMDVDNSGSSYIVIFNTDLSILFPSDAYTYDQVQFMSKCYQCQ